MCTGWLVEQGGGVACEEDGVGGGGGYTTTPPWRQVVTRTGMDQPLVSLHIYQTISDARIGFFVTKIVTLLGKHS